MATHFKKEKAILMRRKGFTYSEILKEVSVAKSTLSLWLREVGLSALQKQQITEKRIAGRIKGAQAQREKRLKLTQAILTDAEADIDKFNLEKLWYVGIALYWAEGSKEKTYRVSQRVTFSNSDGDMVALFIKWLMKCVNVNPDTIRCDLYVHESHKERIPEIIKYWTRKTGFKSDHFKRIYYKKNTSKKIYRKNIGVLYNGLLRVNITSSTSLNRRITGWIQGIIKNCGIV